MRELPTLSQPLNRIADALAYLAGGVSSGVSSARVTSLGNGFISIGMTKSKKKQPMSACSAKADELGKGNTFESNIAKLPAPRLANSAHGEGPAGTCPTLLKLIR
jgi:hypothetical protein